MLTVKEMEKDKNLGGKEETLVEFWKTVWIPFWKTVLQNYTEDEVMKCILGQKLF